MSAPATSVTATPPAGMQQQDVRAAVLPACPQPPDAWCFNGDGTLTLVWLSLVLTAQQQTAVQSAITGATVDPNQPWNVNASLISKAQNALTNNQTFLNIQGTPTNAQVLAQVQALTRQVDAIIQLLLSTGTQVGT